MKELKEMSVSLRVPSLGESVVEGTVARWLVAEGDLVSLDQTLVELTTDKVDVEIPSPCAGVIEKILVSVDDTVEVGAELVLIDESGTVAAASSASSEAASETSEVAEVAATPIAQASSVGAAASSAPPATPLARRAAGDSVDTSQVVGSGSRGRVTQQDVVAHRASSAPSRAAKPAASRAAAAPVASATQSGSAPKAKAPVIGAGIEEGDRVIPMSRLRKLVADHMVYSKRTSPHVGTVAEVDMSAVASLRKANKSSFEALHGISLSFLPFIVNAVVRALRETPALNASVIEDSIVEKRAINIGIAVETEKGLMVPVVRDADRLSLAGLAAAIDELSVRARNKKLSADDLRGGTFTISNPGRKGNLYGFAIINQPQVGILRMGEMVKRPVVRTIEGEDAIVIRSMMHLALSYDHRAVDGSPANGFLYRIRELLESADFDL
jgi:2-oxoglutarate dehydrogenase E2 component (dihydrolipoamide succinyltransferase)